MPTHTCYAVSALHKGCARVLWLYKHLTEEGESWFQSFQDATWFATADEAIEAVSRIRATGIGKVVIHTIKITLKTVNI